MYAYVHYKGLRWNIFRINKVTGKEDAPKSASTFTQYK